MELAVDSFWMAVIFITMLSYKGSGAESPSIRCGFCIAEIEWQEVRKEIIVNFRGKWIGI